MKLIKQLFTKKKTINIPSYVLYVPSRIIYNGKHIKKKDFIVLVNDEKRSHGFGIDSAHYRKVCKARDKYNELNPDNKLPVPLDFKELYDNRIGNYIDMTPIETKFHPIHDKELIEIKTGKRYVIDTVHYQNYMGKYVMLGCRQHGSKSHMHIIWENITSKDPDTIKSEKESKKRFIMVDRFDAWNFC